MSNISQFFAQRNERKKNRKIFVGPQSNITWQVPATTSEIDVHVWGGGGNAEAAGASRYQGGGGGGYASHTNLSVSGGNLLSINVGNQTNDSIVVVNTPVGISTLTGYAGGSGNSPNPYVSGGPGGAGGVGIVTAQPGISTYTIFTANGGNSRLNQNTYLGHSGGGGAGFIYGPGGDSGASYLASNSPVGAGAGGGGIRGDGGGARNMGVNHHGGSGGGFSNGKQGHDLGTPSANGGFIMGGEGLDGSRQAFAYDALTTNNNSSWFYLEDILGLGGGTGLTKVNGTSSNEYAQPGGAGGGGAGAPNTIGGGNGEGEESGGNGGIFGGAGGGNPGVKGGDGGLAGGGAHGGGGPGTGGAGVVIIYY